LTKQAEQSRHHTYSDYKTWRDDERWELIDGVPYSMGPAPTRLHQQIVLELGRQIANFLRERECDVYLAPFDVRLPGDDDEADDAVNTVVQPDISVICDPEKLDEAGCRGAPDWIIEVLSPATAAKDQIHKRALYERHGVQEYWLVHPTDGTVTVYRLLDGQYGKPEISETQGRLSDPTLAGLEIDWSMLNP
jgi:Uma2 family endonuclease